jgi:hypothetical protein
MSALAESMKCNSVEKGPWQGAAAAYGLRRMLVGEHGVRKRLLRPGERKPLREDRTVLVPGPALEVAVVMRIFRRFALLRNSMNRIAADLNAEGIPGPGGRPWKPKQIRAIPRNEVYIGNDVYSIVDPELFANARALFAVRHRRPDSQQAE